jgi:hypothetical protein
LEGCRTRAARSTSGRLNEDAGRLELPTSLSWWKRANCRRSDSRPVGKAVAVPNDGHSVLSMLVRREGETLVQLLIRLDLAIARVDIEDVFTDELSPSDYAPLG